MFKKIISLALVFIFCFAILPNIKTAQAEDRAISGQIKISPDSPSSKGTYTNTQVQNGNGLYRAIGDIAPNSIFLFIVVQVEFIMQATQLVHFITLLIALDIIKYTLRAEMHQDIKKNLWIILK